jgi:hypothetical protein
MAPITCLGTGKTNANQPHADFSKTKIEISWPRSLTRSVRGAARAGLEFAGKYHSAGAGGGLNRPGSSRARCRSIHWPNRSR